MAKPILQRPRIMPRIRQSVPAGMPKHVDVHREVEAGSRTNAFDQPIDGVRCNGPPRSVAKTKPLSGDCRRNSRSARTSSPRSGCTDWLAVLDAPDVKGCRSAEFDLRPFQIANLGSP